jgi:hypothetical protein
MRNHRSIPTPEEWSVLYARAERAIAAAAAQASKTAHRAREDCVEAPRQHPSDQATRGDGGAPEDA